MILAERLGGWPVALLLGFLAAGAAGLWLPSTAFAVDDAAKPRTSPAGWQPEMTLAVTVYVSGGARGPVEVVVRREGGGIERSVAFDSARWQGRRFEFDGLEPGPFLIEAGVDGLEVERRFVPCLDGYVHEVKISLERERQSQLLANDLGAASGRAMLIPVYEGLLPILHAWVLEPGDFVTVARQGGAGWPVAYLKLATGTADPSSPSVMIAQNAARTAGPVLPLSSLTWMALDDEGRKTADKSLVHLVDRALLELGLVTNDMAASVVEIVSDRPFQRWIAIDCANTRVVATGTADAHRMVRFACDKPSVVLEYGGRGHVAGVGASWPLAAGGFVTKNVRGVPQIAKLAFYSGLPRDSAGRFVPCEVLPADGVSGMPLGRWMEVPEDGLVWSNASQCAVFLVRRLALKSAPVFRYETLWVPENVGSRVHSLPAVPLEGRRISMSKALPEGTYSVRNLEGKYVANLALQCAAVVQFMDFPFGRYTVEGPQGAFDVELEPSPPLGVDGPTTSERSPSAAGDAIHK